MDTIFACIQSHEPLGSRGQIRNSVTNARKDQEYVLAYPEGAEIPAPDWGSAVYPNKDKSMSLQAKKNKRVIVFTRMQETDVSVANVILTGPSADVFDILYAVW